MTDDNNYNHSDDNDHEWSRIRILMLRNVKFLSEINRLWNGWRIFKFYYHEIKAIDVYSNMTTTRLKFGKASLISFVISIMHLFRCAVSLKCSVSRKWKKDHLPQGFLINDENEKMEFQPMRAFHFRSVSSPPTTEKWRVVA